MERLERAKRRREAAYRKWKALQGVPIPSAYRAWTWLRIWDAAYHAIEWGI